MDDVEDDMSFPNEDIQRCVFENIESVLETAMWDEKMVPIWKNQIIEKSMKSLIDMKIPYKFIVTCMLIQKSDKHCFSSVSVNWENNSDGVEQVIYPPIRNKESASKTVQCLCTVMGVKF